MHTIFEQTKQQARATASQGMAGSLRVMRQELAPCRVEAVGLVQGQQVLKPGGVEVDVLLDLVRLRDRDRVGVGVGIGIGIRLGLGLWIGLGLG